MITQGWTRITKLIVPIALAATLSGCHSMQVGAPHPFTTMFEKEPLQKQDQVVRAQYLFEAESLPAERTAAKDIESVH